MTGFDEYIRQGEPDKVAKSQIWQVAVGLQKVDNLTPSDYLIETARTHIEGKITIDEVQHRIDNYYKTLPSTQESVDGRTEEADRVSVRIAEILSEKTFSFSPTEYMAIHRRLFDRVYEFAGNIRDYNVIKPEWVLDGETVLYASAPLIRETLDYDFSQEKVFRYKGLTRQQQVEHIVKFISGLWQIHAFGEGNTRTTAVFAIKYLRSFGFDVNNEPFAEHSRYFRNALVRANYNDLTKNIHATSKYLMMFFGNVLFGEDNALKNREMHIRWAEIAESFTVSFTVSPDTVNDTVNDTVFDMIKANPRVTAEEIRARLNISIATVKRRIKALKESGKISRVGSDKTGYWQIDHRSL
jgi:fido (protein-threonine AMPylation protein)